MCAVLMLRDDTGPVCAVLLRDDAGPVCVCANVEG